MRCAGAQSKRKAYYFEIVWEETTEQSEPSTADRIKAPRDRTEIVATPWNKENPYNKSVSGRVESTEKMNGVQQHCLVKGSSYRNEEGW